MHCVEKMKCEGYVEWKKVNRRKFGSQQKGRNKRTSCFVDIVIKKIKQARENNRAAVSIRNPKKNGNDLSQTTLLCLGA